MIKSDGKGKSQGPIELGEVNENNLTLAASNASGITA